MALEQPDDIASLLFRLVIDSTLILDSDASSRQNQYQK